MLWRNRGKHPTNIHGMWGRSTFLTTHTMHMQFLLRRNRRGHLTVIRGMRGRPTTLRRIECFCAYFHFSCVRVIACFSLVHFSSCDETGGSTLPPYYVCGAPYIPYDTSSGDETGGSTLPPYYVCGGPYIPYDTSMLSSHLICTSTEGGPRRETPSSCPR